MSSTEMETILASINEVKTGLSEVKTEVLDMQGDIKKLRAGQAQMGSDLTDLRGQSNRMETRLDNLCKSKNG